MDLLQSPKWWGVPFLCVFTFPWLIYVSGCRILHMNPVHPTHPLGGLLPSWVMVL